MYCSCCGNQFGSTARFCPSCGAALPAEAKATSGYPPPPPPGAFRGQLVRPRSPRVIAGVCSGLAEHYGWDLNVVRLGAVVITLLTGVALFAYIAAWIIIPDGQYALPYGVPPAPPPPPGASTSESAAI
ncbi:PspC domain-containing protein [Granulicella arctica]|uniref:PspC domain-containing protein n=1 Tax=Granulicella arctica TaxID=940613 RepID=UPI0021DF543A|nr:PspC domain-containing protein [Granulicella arctica]